MHRLLVLLIPLFLSFPSRSYANDDVDELVRNRQKQAEQMESLNASNPLSGDLGKNGTAPLTGPLAQAEQILNQPLVQRYMKILQDRNLQWSIEKLVHHPNGKIVLILEGIWFLLIIVIRAWRGSKARHWSGRLFVQLWTTLLYFGGAFGLIPWLLFRGLYLELLDALKLVVGL